MTLEYNSKGEPIAIKQGGKSFTFEDLEREHGTGIAQTLLSWGTSIEDNDKYKSATEKGALEVQTTVLEPKLEKYSESGIRELVHNPDDTDAQKKYAKFAGINLDTNEGKKLMDNRLDMLRSAKYTLDQDEKYNYSLKAHAILTMLSEDEMRGNNVKSINELNNNIARQQIIK